MREMQGVPLDKIGSGGATLVLGDRLATVAASCPIPLFGRRSPFSPAPSVTGQVPIPFR